MVGISVDDTRHCVLVYTPPCQIIISNSNYTVKVPFLCSKSLRMCFASMTLGSIMRYEPKSLSTASMVFRLSKVPQALILLYPWLRVCLVNRVCGVCHV